MAVETFQCPHCRAMLRYSTDLRPGTMVRCPQCQQTFAVPDTEAAPESSSAQPAPSGAAGDVTTEPGAWPRRSGVTEDVPDDRAPRRRYPDDDEDYPRDPYGEGRARDRDAPFSNQYEVDINKWFSIASAHYSAILGPAVGFLLICFAIQIGVSVIGNFVVIATGQPGSNLPIAALNAIFMTPALMGGFFTVCLKQLDGRRWSFADFFTGFQGQYYLKLVAYNLLAMLLSLPMYALLGGALLAGILDAPQEVVMVLAGLGVAVAIVSIYFFTRLFYFVMPLIMDRGLGPIEAMKGSWTLSEGHFWGLFLTYILLGVLAVVGTCACYVGALFTLPLAALVYVAGYLDMAGIDPPLRTPYPSDRWRENG